MSEEIGWVNVLPAIQQRKEACTSAIRALEAAIAALRQASAENDPEQTKNQYGTAIIAWSEFLNKTEELAGVGQALASNYPTQAKYLIGATILENLDIVLLTGSVLRSLSEMIPGETDPLKLASEQPQMLRFAKEVITQHFPDSIAHFLGKFTALGLPTTGMPDSATLALPAYRASVIAGDSSSESIKILHISDLHRTPDEPVSNTEIGSSLVKAIKRFDGGSVDLIAVTGDLSQSATSEQYAQFEELVNYLVKNLLNDQKERCIIVPGNHDIDWAASAKGLFSLNRRVGDARLPEQAGVVPLCDLIVRAERATLESNTKPFRDSYERFYGKAYPVDDKKRCLVYFPPRCNVTVIGIDTTLGMSHLNTAPYVDRDSLITALDEAEAQVSDRPFIIAIGHHGPVRRASQKDAIDTWVLDRLLDNGVKLYIHGHEHETRVYHHSMDGEIRIISIGVGSLVAGPKERPESPRHYNIIELPSSSRARGRVWVRRKDKRDSPWAPYKNFGLATNLVDFIDL